MNIFNRHNNPVSQSQQFLDITIDVAETKIKQKSFKDEFSSVFTEKLTSYDYIGSGRTAATVKYTTLGSLVKSILETSLNSAISAVPVVGPFAAVVLTSLPGQIYEYYERRHISRESAEVSNTFVKIGEEVICRTIEETAHEITRIFEQQIALLKSPNYAKKLANFAVQKIFEHSEIAKTHQQVEFNQEELIKALLVKDTTSTVDKIGSKFSIADNLETVHGISWKTRNVFYKVGLRVEGLSGSYTYKTLPSMQTPKYGYRGSIFNWNDGAKTYVASQLDSIFTEIVHRVDQHTSYIPYQRIVQQNEIDAYINQISGPNAKIFKEFFKQNNFIDPGKEIIPVLRHVKIVQDISGGDFSHCDLSKIALFNIKAIGCNFSESRMISANLVNVNMTNSTLKGTDLKWSVLHNVNLSGDANLVQTDFNYAIIGEETDLTNNISFGSAFKEHAHILTEKIAFTILDEITKLGTSEILSAAKLSTIEEELEKVKIALWNSQEEIVEEFCLFNAQQEVPLFIDRGISSSRVKDFFTKSDDKFAIAVITGGMGTGKTQLVLEYIAKNRGFYQDRIFWISAENKDSITESFKDLAERLNISITTKSDEEILHDVQKKLEILSCTLLVFDGVNDRSLIKDYLPAASSHHHALITTQDSASWPKDYHVEYLESFSEDDAITYIQNHLKEKDLSKIKKLTSLFGYLPFGLSQAVAYMKKYDLQIPQFMDYYQSNKAEVLKEDELEDAHVKGIFSSFSLEIGALARKSSKAIEILKICAYLEHEAIPESLFDKLFNFNKLEKTKAINALKSSSLISIIQTESSGRVFSLHKMFQEVIKIQLAEEK